MQVLFRPVKTFYICAEMKAGFISLSIECVPLNRLNVDPTPLVVN